MVLQNHNRYLLQQLNRCKEPSRKSNIHINIGKEHLRRGGSELAETSFRAALSLRRAVFHSQSIKIARALQYLALSLSKQKKLSEACECLEEALLIQQNSTVGSDLDTSILYHELGNVLFEMGFLDAAKEAYSAQIAIRSRVLGSIDSCVADAIVRIGGIHLKMGNVQIARSTFEEASRIRFSLLCQRNEVKDNGCDMAPAA